jgi:hypothetical protein
VNGSQPHFSASARYSNGEESQLLSCGSTQVDSVEFGVADLIFLLIRQADDQITFFLGPGEPGAFFLCDHLAPHSVEHILRIERVNAVDQIVTMMLL